MDTNPQREADAGVGDLNDVTWFDLSTYRMQLQLVPGNPGSDLPHRLRVRGRGVESYAEELRALGFDRLAGDWVRPADLVLSDLASALRREFPQVGITKVPRTIAVGRDDDATQVSYTTVSEHRGNARVWLEGLRLNDAGFRKGATYTVTLDPGRRTITLALAEHGDRAVSGRTRPNGKTTPIIDVASEDLSALVQQGMRLQVVVRPGLIQFTLAPREAAKLEREARTRNEVQRGYLTEGTLCAGGGIATLAVAQGVEQGGLRSRVDFIVDRERRYLEVAHENNPAIKRHTQIFEASLEELAPELLPKTSLMQISLPCTGHSLSGKAKRGLAVAEEHPTDALAVYGSMRLIDAVQPSVVISENVTQAATSASYALMRAYFQEAGYKVFETTMDHTDAGAIEARKRWWMLAISEGLAKGFTLDDLPKLAKRHATLGEVLEPIADDDPMWSRNAYLDVKAERDAAAGKGFKRQFVGPESETVGTVGRGYYKRRSTEPFVKREDGMERLLTPVEHARVKGIPEGIVRDAGNIVGHEVLGQSILFGHGVLLGQKVATHLLDVVGEDPDPTETKPKRRGPGL